MAVCREQGLEEFFRSLRANVERLQNALQMNDRNLAEHRSRHLERYLQIICAMSGLLITNGHHILAGLLDDLAAELANFYHHAENEIQNMYLCEEASIYPGSEVKDTESRKETSTGGRRRLLIECDTIVSLRESGYS